MSRTAIAIVFAALALALFQSGLMTYEQLAFGWPFAREEVPIHDSWHWLRRLANAALCFALVAALARPGLRSEPLPRGSIVAAGFTAVLSLLAAILLVASPPAYAVIGAEDGAIEWLTALFLLAASGFMALRLAAILAAPPYRRRWLHLLGAAGFTLLFFVMAGEEVSWLQRQIGFSTPESIAAHNWQGEFNLHNFQTDMTELALYAGTGIFLMLLPLIRESEVARWPIFEPYAAFLPDRSVAAISAPMLIFTYSHWTLLPVQAAFWIGLAICLTFARTATSPAERLLWGALALWAAVGQLLHLLLGHTMVAMYDSSEYRELFFTFGLAAYGWRQWRGESLTQTEGARKAPA